MSSFNKVIMLGNLTRDPELRVIPNGTALTNFSLAVNRKFSTNGQQREEVLFIDCEAWASSAENIAKYCAKGSALLVEGHLKLDSWEDKTTKEKRSRIKIVVGTFQFIGSKPAGASAPSATAGAPIHDKPNAGGSYATRLPAAAPKPVVPEEDEDEILF